jgi:hypothetical protein
MQGDTVGAVALPARLLVAASLHTLIERRIFADRGGNWPDRAAMRPRLRIELASHVLGCEHWTYRPRPSSSRAGLMTVPRPSGSTNRCCLGAGAGGASLHAEIAAFLQSCWCGEPARLAAALIRPVSGRRSRLVGRRKYRK